MHSGAAAIHKLPTSDVTRDQGTFRIRLKFPGRAVPDHGYGPLATVVESFMDPDTLITMHPTGTRRSSRGYRRA